MFSCVRALTLAERNPEVTSNLNDHMQFQQSTCDLQINTNSQLISVFLSYI